MIVGVELSWLVLRTRLEPLPEMVLIAFPLMEVVPRVVPVALSLTVRLVPWVFWPIPTDNPDAA